MNNAFIQKVDSVLVSIVSLAKEIQECKTPIEKQNKIEELRIFMNIVENELLANRVKFYGEGFDICRHMVETGSISYKDGQLSVEYLEDNRQLKNLLFKLSNTNITNTSKILRFCEDIKTLIDKFKKEWTIERVKCLLARDRRTMTVNEYNLKSIEGRNYLLQLKRIVRLANNYEDLHLDELKAECTRKTQEYAMTTKNSEEFLKLRGVKRQKNPQNRRYLCEAGWILDKILTSREREIPFESCKTIARYIEKRVESCDNWLTKQEVVQETFFDKKGYDFQVGDVLIVALLTKDIKILNKKE